MTLASALATPPSRRNGPTCGVGDILDNLPDADRAALEAALLPGSGWKATDITRVLVANGHNVRADAVQRHRRRAQGNGCECPR